MTENSEPQTRSLEEVVDALDVVMSELGFQIMRLTRIVNPRTDTEREYLPKLKEGYEGAQYWLGVLRRYHRGRLDRQRAGEAQAKIAAGEGPFMDEEIV